MTTRVDSVDLCSRAFDPSFNLIANETSTVANSPPSTAH
jgi:hypothetical protein